jgi:hypothetical protein
MMNPDISFPSCLKQLYATNPFFSKVAEDLHSYQGFPLHDGLFHLSEQGINVLCIPQGKIDGISVHEMLISHTHSLLAHLSG